MLFGIGGLTLAAPRVIPGLAPTDALPPDVILHLGVAPPWHRPSTANDNEREIAATTHVRLTRRQTGFSLHYSDGTQFWIDADGRCVWMTWTTTFEDACTYLTGPVIAFVLRVRGELALHASAIQAGDFAYAFVGPHGSGKSTTAAALARRGFAILTDDVLRLTHDGNRWFAHPFGTMLRLWPDAGTVIFGSNVPLPRITASWDKRALSFGSHGVSRAPRAVALGGLVLLAPADQPHASSVVPVPMSETLVRLAANSAAAHFLDTAQRAAEFARLSRVAAEVPCVSASRDDDDAPELFVDRLCAWFASQHGRVPA